MQANRFWQIAIIALTCSASAATAQTSDNGVVAGTGTVTLTRRPEVMRLQIAVQAQGGKMVEALFKLKKRLERAHEEVERLGAKKESIKVAETRIKPPLNDARQRQMQILAGRAVAVDPLLEKNKTATPISVSAVLSAEWEFKGKAGHDLLIAVHALQEEIKDADLSGIKKDAEATNAEKKAKAGDAEEVEGNEELMNEFADQNEPKPGEPVFVFVCRFSEDEIRKATAEAFRKASKDAARLADAADVGLGKLRSLNSSNVSGGDMDNYGYSGSNMLVYQAIQTARLLQGEVQANGADEGEAFGIEPILLKYNINVMAAFDIESKK